MPQPTRSDVHVNRPLTSVAIRFLQNQNDFIANRVFPNVPVRNQSDVYYTYPKGNWFRSDAKERAPGTESAGSGYNLSTDTYYAKPYALHKDVDDQIRANADDVLNMDVDATEYVTRDLMLGREINWAAKYFTTSVWSADVTPGTLWSASGSTPISDIRTRMGIIKSATGFTPNKLVLAEDVWIKLQDNADFLDRIQITQRKIVTTELLASVLGLDEVMILGAVKNSAKEGATDSLTWVGSKDALLVYAAPRPSVLQPSAGYTFSWTGYLGAGQDGLRVSRFRMEHLRSDRVEAEMAYDQKLVASELGVFFNNAIA